MAEAMTSESIIEAEWVLKGYWTKVRFPFQSKGGGWSDVDVLAYDPESKHLVVSESKVQGSKNLVDAYTKDTRRRYPSITEFEDAYFEFLRNLPRLCENGVIFSRFDHMVKLLTVQLVSNCAVSPDMLESAKQDVTREIDRYGLSVPVDPQLDTTIEVIARIIKAERASTQGRRYGHPVLDLAREMNRYFFPSVRGAGRSNADITEVKEQLVASFLKAIGR